MDLKILKDLPPWEWPEDADETFLKILGDAQADESDRLLAAELAGDSTVIHDDLVEALLSIVRSADEPERLRAKAAISLGPVLEETDTEMPAFPEDIPISEDTFHKIQETLRKLYMDTDVPKEVRRRVLEASVRAPEDWHSEAIRSAYAGDDADWNLTAVFCMSWVRGFDDQILEALESENPAIHYHAVEAAGNWELDGAWPHISALVTSEDTDKPLRLAAIDALAGIRPKESGMVLGGLTGHDDEEIVEAAYDAMAMVEGPQDEYEEEYADAYDDDDEDEDDSLYR